MRNIENIRGHWAISFINSTFSFDQISQLVLLNPTNITMKGQTVSEALRLKSEKNIQREY